MKLLYVLLLCFIICNHVMAQQVDSTQCDILQCTEDGVGIDTKTIPTGYKLAVNGKILMENGRVDVESEWPDYVFKEGYNVMDVAELKKYIQANGHLPNVPSAANIKKEGMDVAEMNVLLMQKIEELSLYIIQLQERLNKLKRESELKKTK